MLEASALAARPGVMGVTGEAIADLLRSNWPLSYINLSDNKLNGSSAEAIAEALQFNTKLKQLIMRGNGEGLMPQRASS